MCVRARKAIASAQLIIYTGRPCQSTIAENDIAIFAKSTCPYCRRARGIVSELNTEGKKVSILDINTDGHDGPAIQAYLLEKTGQRTVPNIFIVCGRSVWLVENLECRRSLCGRSLIADISCLTFSARSISADRMTLRRRRMTEFCSSSSMAPRESLQTRDVGSAPTNCNY